MELSRCVKNVLTRANDELGCTSIAFPAISSGLFGFPVDLCAATILDTLDIELTQRQGGLNLKDIRILILDQVSFAAFRREFVAHYPIVVDPTTLNLPANDSTDVMVDLILPMKRKAGLVSVVEEASQKEDAERTLLALVKKEEEAKVQGEPMVECEVCKECVLINMLA